MTARRWLSLAAGAAVAAAAVGCHLVQRTAAKVRDHRAPPAAPVTYSQYHLDGFRWEDVRRVLVLPVLNESPHTRAGDEIRAALTSELQRLGRFEVVAAPADDQAILARRAHRGGRFSEADLFELGRETNAEVVVHVTVTQYSPYPRPRLGMVVQAVGPLEGKVVASVDGLWDTTDAGVAEQVRTFYRQRPRPQPPFVRNRVIATDDVFAGELALDSPALFQRWACHLVACLLVGLPVDPLTGAAGEDCPTPAK
jgi:hypothetical protein